jgi:hypothetical protein
MYAGICEERNVRNMVLPRKFRQQNFHNLHNLDLHGKQSPCSIPRTHLTAFRLGARSALSNVL